MPMKNKSLFIGVISFSRKQVNYIYEVNKPIDVLMSDASTHFYLYIFLFHPTHI